MRFGLTILPELSWVEAAPRWQAAEVMGFDHAWTYDHIVWSGLPDAPWFGAVPTLTAAAVVTSTIRLGTFVASPNFRDPVAFHRDVQALDDISGGRFLLGLGKGGDVDSRIIGGADLTVRQRIDRFQEFVDLLARLRTDDRVDADGTWFGARGVPAGPPLRDVPLLIAANGPRSVRHAAAVGDGWVTTGPMGADGLDAWWEGVAASIEVLDEALVANGREPAAFPRYLSLDSSPVYSLQSVDAFESHVGRAAELGITDVVLHWPRPDGPYAGDPKVLDEVATRLGDWR